MTSVFEAMVNHASIGLIAFDDSLNCLFINQKAQEILEAQTTDLKPGELNIRSLFGDRERADSHRILALDQDLMQHDGFYSVVLMQKLNGHNFLAQLTLNRIFEADRVIRVMSIQDITLERKMARELSGKQEEIERAYKELLDQNRQLKELDHAKDRFIALTTHELRTPLSAIIATAEVLELQLYESESQREQFIRTISEQGRHLMELVNDILDFAKIRAGKMEFYIERIDIKKFTESILLNFTSMAEQAGVHLDLTVRQDEKLLDAFGWIDSLRYKEVLNNVISNSIKYNRPGGAVHLTANLVGDENHIQFIRITCHDTGQGIPVENFESVFSEFETGGSVSQHHRGTGLGMPIARRLMQQMGGALSFQSQLGVGSQFFVDVPLTQNLDPSFYRSRPDRDDDLAA